MRQEDIWDEVVAEGYDNSDTAMFAPDVLGPTVDRLAESVDILKGLFAAAPLSYAGKYYHITDLDGLPKPVQAPHPPMFAACTKPESAVAVGKLGLGALNFAFGNDEYLTQKVTEYRAAVANAKPIGRQKNDWFACTPATLVLKDDEKALRHGTRGARFFLNALSRYYFGGDRPIGHLDIPRDDLTGDELRDARQLPPPRPLPRPVRANRSAARRRGPR